MTQLEGQRSVWKPHEEEVNQTENFDDLMWNLKFDFFLSDFVFVNSHFK